jgi:hypothetical protein
MGRRQGAVEVEEEEVCPHCITPWFAVHSLLIMAPFSFWQVKIPP